MFVSRSISWVAGGLLSLAVAASAPAAAQSQPQCIDLGPARQFNAFVAWDYWGWSSDVEGSLGVGGSAHLYGYSVGARLTAEAPFAAALVAGRDVELYGVGVQGNVSYGTSIALGGVGIAGTTAQESSFDFGAAGASLATASAAFAALPANGATSSQWGALHLDGSDPSLNVFTVQAWELASSWGVYVNVPAGSSVVVNVAGDGAKFWYMDVEVPGVAPEQVIWNLPDVTWLQVEGVGVVGSVLAPRAWVSFSNGVIQGQLFGAGFDGSGQTNLHPFGACVAPAAQGQPAE